MPLGTNHRPQRASSQISRLPAVGFQPCQALEDARMGKNEEKSVDWISVHRKEEVLASASGDHWVIISEPGKVARHRTGREPAKIATHRG